MTPLSTLDAADYCRIERTGPGPSRFREYRAPQWGRRAALVLREQAGFWAQLSSGPEAGRWRNRMAVRVSLVQNLFMVSVNDPRDAVLLNRWEIDEASGTIVVIDVLRAFTTAACAFAAGAQSIYLVETVDEALAFKAENSAAVAMGESHGLRPDGFDLSNSPGTVVAADLEGRIVVQCTSAGTAGAVAAAGAPTAWAASLVCASATATYLSGEGHSEPSYLITGCFVDSIDVTGEDDRLAARLIERVRRGLPKHAEETATALASTYEAERCRNLPPAHSHPDDVSIAADVDRFDFAMQIVTDDGRVRLECRA